VKRRKVLYQKQLAVIDDLVIGVEDEAKILKRHRVSRRLYRRWLCQEAFADELRRGVEAARHRNMLQIARHVPAAVEGLVEMIRHDNSEVKRKACLDLLGLGNCAEKDAEVVRGPRVSKGQASRILEVLAEKEAG